MIPKIIHHISDPKDETKWHPYWKPCYQSSLRNFLNFEHMIWDMDDLNRLVSTHYPQFLDLMNWFPENISRYDFCRYLILHKFGGIYMDMDLYVVNNFYDDLNEGVNLIESLVSDIPSWQEKFGNCLMASSKNNSFWMHLCNYIHEICDRENYKTEMENTNKENDIHLGWIIRSTTGGTMLSRFIEITNRDVNMLSKIKYSPKYKCEYDQDKNHLNFNVDSSQLENLRTIHLTTGQW